MRHTLGLVPAFGNCRRLARGAPRHASARRLDTPLRRLYLRAVNASRPSGDGPLNGAERRAYYRYGVDEIRAELNAEPGPVARLSVHEDLARLERAMRRGSTPLRAYADLALVRAIAKDCPTDACVLDLGCGKGSHATFYEQLGHTGTYVGLDIAPRPQWEALAAKRGPVRCEFIAGPAETAPLGRDRFDFSMSHSALEHIAGPEAAVRNVFAAMKPGARGFYCVPAPWSLLLYGPHGYRRYTAQALVELFEGAGFEVVELLALGGGASFALHLAWITWLETGIVYDVAALGALPRPVREGLRTLGRLPLASRSGAARGLYGWLGRAALRADASGPVHGHAIRIRKPG
jgi:SAM-dependent methyltransferase